MNQFSIPNQRLALIFSRCLMASLFVFSGLEKLFDYPGAVAFAAAFHVPLARYTLAGAIVVELVGAVALVVPRSCRPAAVVLTLWVFGLNLWFHQFWTVPATEWQQAVDGFFHHWVMIGGLLYVAVLGAGPNGQANAEA